MSSISIQDTLSDSNAFYNQSNYENQTNNAFATSKPPEVIYEYNTENEVWRVVKDIFSVLIFPIGLGRLIHSLVGRLAYLPAARKNDGAKIREESLSKTSWNDLEWKVKRLAIKVDGYVIDAAIISKRSTLDNGRWVLASNGNNALLEEKILECSDGNEFTRILSEMDGNGLVFNYPGVGSSTGMPSRAAMAKAYRAMLTFLEDQENGIGAKEIIGYGHSIGGASQGEALKSHKLKQGIKYVFIKSRTFSTMSKAASELKRDIPILSKPVGFLTKVLGWNMSSVSSSKKLKAPEIIIQTEDDSQKILDDGIITAKASLGKKLMDSSRFPQENKRFMGIKEGHNKAMRLNTARKLAGFVNEMMTEHQVMKKAPLKNRLFMMLQEMPAFLSTGYKIRYEKALKEENLLTRIIKVIPRYFQLIKEVLSYQPTTEAQQQSLEKITGDFVEISKKVQECEKPICAYFVGSDDHNGAITGDHMRYYHRYKIQKLEKHFAVSAKVVENTQQIFEHLKELKDKYPDREIKVVDIVAHGSSDSIGIATKGYDFTAKDAFADCAEDASIILDACSVGTGRNSIAENIARANPKKSVMAPGKSLYFSKPLFKTTDGQTRVDDVIHGFSLTNAYTSKKFTYVTV